MTKITAIINLVAGILFALTGVFVLCRSLAFLSDPPRNHDGLVAWAFMIVMVGLCLVIGGVRYVRLGASQLQGPEMPEDF
jgi:divalent metal cation (Fe/Co/Zn/Cd) transporter